MYPLFELVRLLSLRPDELGAHSEGVRVACYGWQEAGESNLLALVCTNGYILLRYSVSGRQPVVKQLPWLLDNPIIACCFDPSVTWLLVLTAKLELFIIPALALMDDQIKINHLWRIDDVTDIKVKKLKGSPTTVCWWHTMTDRQVAVIGMSQGTIVFVDLFLGRVLASSSFGTRIAKLELIHDNQQTFTHILVTAWSGAQWKLLLEKFDPPGWNHNVVLDGMVFKEKNGKHSTILSILDQTAETKPLFQPVTFTHQFPLSTHLSTQYAKGRHFISGHCDKSCTYQIYDSFIQRSPLFVYKLPPGAHNILFTDKLVFLNTRHNGKKLLLLSNQKSEISLGSQQDFNDESVLQVFDLSPNEPIVAVVKRSFPFYWHDKQEANLGDSATSCLNSHDVTIASHTVLDGCLVITSSSLYECRPRISPERLFLELAIQPSEMSCAENLAISLNLDVNSLFELAAGYMMTKQEFSHAARLFQMAKCLYIKRVAAFASCGRINEMMTYIKQALNRNSSKMSATEAKWLADMALYGHLYQIQAAKEENSALIASFKEFLLTNFLYDEKAALQLLAEWEWVDLLLELAKARGLIVESLQLLIKQNYYHIDQSLLLDLVSKGFGMHLTQAGNGVFLHCMSAENVVDLLCMKPHIAVYQVDVLQRHVLRLDTDRLLKLAEVFDPSRSVVRGHLTHHQILRRRTFSQGSLNSLSLNFGEVSSLEVPLALVEKMVDFFFVLIITLNKKRDSESETHEDLLPSEQNLDHLNFEFPQMMGNRLACPKQKAGFQPSLIGCGSNHVALVRNGNLYTWGKAQYGRLGHGNITAENSICSPSRVETLHMLKIKALSVACGEEHTVVLTNQGLYGWGSSKYGQVGVGTRHNYGRPMLIEVLSSVFCVAIDCGQHHSVVTTEEGEVYSWGWGIHGQLGHGDAEDQLQPVKLQALRRVRIKRIAAGLAHTVLLDAAGNVFTCGCGYFGQLGHGDTLKQSLPKRVPLNTKIFIIATKSFHCVAVGAENEVYTWGSHPYLMKHLSRKAWQRMLGEREDPTESFLRPSVVDCSFVHGKIYQVSCGSYHSLLATNEGEVYTWGKNTEGQLGISTYQDVKSPSMVTTINDRKIVCIQCGSEYSMAMDADGELWVWGKNDSGQLLHNQEGRETGFAPKSAFRRDQSNDLPTSVGIPISMHGLPPLKMRTGSLLSTDSTDSDIYRSEDCFEDSKADLLIPSLESISGPKYSRQVVSVLLEFIPNWCQSLRLVQQCIKHHDWRTAILVTVYLKHYPQALTFHLWLLNENRDHVRNDFLPLTIRIIEFYLSHIINQEISNSAKEENIHTVIVQMLYHWDKNELPSADLERFFEKYLNDVAPVLSLFLFRERNLEQQQQLSELHGTTFQKFSPRFCLNVLSVVFQKLGRDLDKSSPRTSSIMKKMVDKMTPSSWGSLSASDRLVPCDHLWQEIMQNLIKVSESKNSINLSHTELDHLLTRCHLQQCPDSIDNSAQSEAVVFTCGHHYAKRTFVNDILVDFSKTVGTIHQLPQTASILVECYNRKELLPLACPKCVLTAIQTE